MPRKDSDVVITFTVSKGVKEALERWARDEDRSMSYLVRKLVEKELDSRLYVHRDEHEPR